jgi:hypothetical protein
LGSKVKKEYAFCKIKCLFMIKSAGGGRGEKYSYIIKIIYKNPTTNTILHGEKLKDFPPISGT